jgi:hypothetical protein
MKRWRARARGRVARIKKPTCHITVKLVPATDGAIAPAPAPTRAGRAAYAGPEPETGPAAETQPEAEAQTVDEPKQEPEADAQVETEEELKQETEPRRKPKRRQSEAEAKAHPAQEDRGDGGLMTAPFRTPRTRQGAAKLALPRPQSRP